MALIFRTAEPFVISRIMVYYYKSSQKMSVCWQYLQPGTELGVFLLCKVTSLVLDGEEGFLWLNK